MISITKEMLNKQLQIVMKGSYGTAVVENSMISAKWVDIKADRTCYSCKSIIPKGTTALTSSKRNNYNRPERIHRCYLCGCKSIDRLHSNNCEKSEGLFWDEVGNDFGYDIF